jgi:hypothetical protein
LSRTFADEPPPFSDATRGDFSGLAIVQLGDDVNEAIRPTRAAESGATPALTG